jgi:urease accessory protein
MATPLAYGLGFMVATATLHAAGIGLFASLSRLSGRVATRAAGGLAAGYGLVLAFAA